MPSPVGHVIAGVGAAWVADLAPGARSWRTAAPAASFFRRAGGLLTIVCGALGALPDVDLFFGVHRTVTHSILATVVISIVAALVTAWVTTLRESVSHPVGQSASRAVGQSAGPRGTQSASRPINQSATRQLDEVSSRRGDERRAVRAKVIRIALMCGAAYGSHLILDWLAVDRNPPAGFQLLWPFSDAWFISGLDLFPQTERRRFLSWPSVQTNLIAIAWESATLLPIAAMLWLIRVKTLARFAAQLAGRDHTS